MAIKMEEIRQYITNFKFEELFNHLGWDNATLPQTLFGRDDIINVNGEEVMIDAIAQKRQVVVFHINFLPDNNGRREIDQKITKRYREHIIIYTDADQTEQIWQWVRREPGKSVVNRELGYKQGQSAEQLTQKLYSIAFSLEEEDNLNLVVVSGRLKAAFDLEPVTQAFYKQFREEHEKFLAFIEGIEDLDTKHWYVSVMLNRLMFIYFVQYKGFLDNNTDYLRSKLNEIEIEEGNYYRDFLKILFFKGFALKLKDRTSDVKQRLGDVPYLNGGLFMPHQIEREYGNVIQIPNEAFAKIFAFFDKYRWHLNEQALAKDNEINPDVLGYIFERYINSFEQKEKGAYYTQEDITEYISKNTIIPYLFDAVKKQHSSAFEGDGSIWKLLTLQPDEYIYDAMSKGIRWTQDYDDNAKIVWLDEPLKIPNEIEVGRSDVSKRDKWNTPTPLEYGLPREIWRETVARYERYYEVKNKLVKGEVQSINDLITYNLDIQNFAQKVIFYADPELLSAFWKQINEVTVLDPTCGSGAFLFAALNILEPLYKACLSHMQILIDDAEHKGETFPKRENFRKILERVDEHPNEDYFVLKTIIVNNLYGVDIMEEAIEIAKLRLFLKMVAQINDHHRIEPLPDIDFSIRAGNTLVGFATKDEVWRALTTDADGNLKIVFGEEQETLESIEEKAEDIDRLFDRFREQQTELGGEIRAEDKDKLRSKLQPLEEQLNQLLSGQYGVDFENTDKYSQWRKAHTPFHWFVEFYGVISDGGFDVIIGNPPYVEYSKVRDQYKVRGYVTESTGNLYAMVMERCLKISNHSGAGNLGVILPSSAFSTERMKPFIQQTSKMNRWLSFYDFRPSKLFGGVNLRLSIGIFHHLHGIPQTYSTTYNRWYSEERNLLFNTRLKYHPVDFQGGMAIKIGNEIEQTIFKKVNKATTPINKLIGLGKETLYFHNAILYWIRGTDFAPSHEKYLSSHVKTLYFPNITNLQATSLVLNSTLFYWWWVKISNCRDLNGEDILRFNIPDSLLKNTNIELHLALMQDLMRNSAIKTRNQKQTGLVNYREFNPVLSKHIIDEIDRVLAKHYGFTDEELDFIINYDIKYRMGNDLNDGIEGDE